MTTENKETVEIEEVSAVLAPEPGEDIYDVLQSAQLRGYQSITVNRETNTATIVFFRHKETVAALAASEGGTLESGKVWRFPSCAACTRFGEAAMAAGYELETWSADIAVIKEA